MTYYRHHLSSKISALVLVCCSCLLLSGCTARLAWLDGKLGQGFREIENSGLGAYVDFLVSGADRDDISSSSTPGTTTVRATTSPEEIAAILSGLTQDQKEKIEDWLQATGLNRYGDPAGTRYDYGTPLLDRENDKNIDRFEYILSNHPEIIDEILDDTKGTFFGIFD